MYQVRLLGKGHLSLSPTSLTGACSGTQGTYSILCLKNYEAFFPLVWQSEQLVHLSSYTFTTHFLKSSRFCSLWDCCFLNCVVLRIQVEYMNRWNWYYLCSIKNSWQVLNWSIKFLWKSYSMFSFFLMLHGSCFSLSNILSAQGVLEVGAFLFYDNKISLAH